MEGNQPAPKTAERRWGWALLVAAILAGGALLAWRQAGQADRRMREVLLAQARLVAEALSIDQVRVLAGAESDLARPEYRRLKAHFAALKQADGRIRFVYLAGRRPSGEIFFFVDNEPADSPDHSPPGQAYPEASAEFRRVFASGEAAVGGPVADRWGAWVSGLVPLADPQAGGAVIAVLGLDVAADDWRRDLARAALPAALLALALAAILLAAAALLRRRSRLAGATPPWMEHLEPALAAAAGLALTLFAAWAARQGGDHARSAAFAHVAAARTAAVSETLRVFRNIELEGLARFHEGSELVTVEEFAHFASPLVRNLSLHLWAWVPAVIAAQREEVEARARADGLEGFAVWRPDGRGGRAPASGKDVEYPVLHVAPRAGNEEIVGRDLGADPAVRPALDEAARTGMAAASEPLEPGEWAAGLRVMFVCRPVFERGDPGLLRGFAAGVLRLDSLLGAAGGDGVRLGLALLRGGGEPEALAADWTGDRPPAAGPAFVRPVLLFGRTFAVSAFPDEDFLRLHPAQEGGRTLLAGLALSAALAWAVSLATRRSAALERLAAERTARLQESEANYRELFRTAPIGIFQTTPAGGFLAVNPEYARIAGYANPEEMIAQVTDIAAQLYVRPAERERYKQHLKQQGRVQNYEAELKRKDGTPFWVSMNTTMKLTPAGEAIYAGFLADVTERKRAEEALAESERRYRAIFENAPVGIMLLDSRGIVTGCNPRFAGIFGAETKDYLGLDLAASLQDERFRAALDEMLRRGESWVEGPYTSVVTGRELHLRLHGVGMGPDLFLVMVEDITGPRRAEAEVQRLNRDLEGLVAQRTAELTERTRELEAANLRLRELDEMKSAILTSVSHELRTPLTSVLGFAAVTRKAFARFAGASPAADPVQERRAGVIAGNLEIIEEQGRRLTRLINDFLELSRIESDRLAWRDQEQDPAPVLRRAVQAAAGELAARPDLAFTADIPGRLPPVRLDADRLEQLVLNLVNNAVKFTPAGQVRLGAAAGEGVLRLCVEDTGVGLRRADLRRVFDTFYQARREGDEGKHPGTGLGLAICRQIVEHYGGEIWAESAPGRGSRFLVELPLAAGAGPEDDP